MIWQVYSEFIKTFKSWQRNPIIIAMGLLTPLLLTFVFIQSFAMPSGMKWNIAVVSDDGEILPNSWKAKFIHALEVEEGTIPYFNPVLVSKEEAEAMLKSRQTFMIVTIPAGFEANLTTNQPVTIYAQINNIHEDLSKNMRLGLEARIYQFSVTYQLANDRPAFTIDRELVFPVELARSDYMMNGVLVFISIFVAALYGGVLAAQEKDKGTWSEIVMECTGPYVAIIGKLLATVVISGIYVGFIVLFNWLFYDYSLPNFSSLLALIIVCLCLILVFGLFGVLYGMKVGDFRLIPAPSVTVTFTFYVISGTINPLEFSAGSEIFKYSPTAAAVRVLTIFMFNRGQENLLEASVTLGVWTAFPVIIIIILVLKTYREK